MDLVFFSETINQIIFMFIYSAFQIISYADIQRSVSLIREYINMVGFHLFYVSTLDSRFRGNDNERKAFQYPTPNNSRNPDR